MIVDACGKPWLLEVNSSPALDLDSDVDVVVKTQLINDTLDLLAFRPPEEHWPAQKNTQRRRMEAAKHSRRSSDIPKSSNFTLPDLRPKRQKVGGNAAKPPYTSLETVTVDCSQSLTYPGKMRESSRKAVLDGRKADIGVERDTINPRILAKVEELTRTRPAYTPSEGRPAACGLYELICPVTPVSTI